MREDGRELDHKVLEAMRIRAVDQVGKGAISEDSAAALGLHRKIDHVRRVQGRPVGRLTLVVLLA